MTFPTSVVFLYFARIGSGIGVVPVLVSPLIADYTKRTKRGLSNAYANVASTAGILIATQIIPIVSNSYGLRTASFVFAMVFFVTSLVILLLLKNPPKKQVEHVSGK